MNAIKEKELDQQVQMQAQDAQQEVDQIKKQAQEDILRKRLNLKAKIAEMRKKALLKQQSLQQKLQTIKITSAQRMQSKYKDGDKGKCASAMKQQSSRESYCIGNASDDILKFSRCKDPEQFCNFCCENEFGDFRLSKRTECQMELCITEQKKGNNVEVQGRWIWQAPV